MALRKKSERSEPKLAAVGDEFMISEEGRNGSIVFTTTGLERMIKKSFGRNDREFIPYQSIGSVAHNRKSMGLDRVAVRLAGNEIEWKILGDAETFVNTLQSALVSGGLKPPAASSADPVSTEPAAPAQTAPSSAVTPLPPGAPAAWQADPTGRHEMRYWDGNRWTDDVSDAGTVSKDPV